MRMNLIVVACGLALFGRMVCVCVCVKTLLIFSGIEFERRFSCLSIYEGIFD